MFSEWEHGRTLGGKSAPPWQPPAKRTTLTSRLSLIQHVSSSFLSSTANLLSNKHDPLIEGSDA